MIHTAEGRWVKVRELIAPALILLALFSGLPSFAQPNSGLEEFFRNDIGLNSGQIADIRKGKPVVKALPSRTPAEVFLFGVVYINAAPESYIQFAHDFDRLRNLSNYLAFGVFSDPPQLSDLTGFSLDEGDMKALRNCRPGDCLIQMPASSMEQAQRSINWSAPDVEHQVDKVLHQAALEFLLRYREKGNQALGAYNDKRDPTDLSQRFAYILSYSKALPEQLPEFYRYLLTYPENRPANVDDMLYWAKVKFGLKPTLRIVQIFTLKGGAGSPVAYAIAEKQLYSSH